MNVIPTQMFTEELPGLQMFLGMFTAFGREIE
jgi:hypothetical protein